jgi:phosphoglucomutase
MQRVSFGTSGHRGTSTKGTFNENHILAISQAIVEYRKASRIAGPLFIGMDSHALSLPAQQSAIEVLSANGAEVYMAAGDGLTPTPAISHAILKWNRENKTGIADGIVITPSHNPPSSGGFKYNPPNGGPADTAITRQVEDRANEIMLGGCNEIKRMSYQAALKAANIHTFDFVTPYVTELSTAIDMEAIRSSDISIGVDPLGGAGLPYWEPIADLYGLDLSIVNNTIDMTFKFMSVDHDGKIRMDCSSPYAMANLVRLKSNYDIAFGNDPDADRHGIVTPTTGLMDPNAFLAVSIWYLFSQRAGWTKEASVGKTVVSSSFIDRVSKLVGRKIFEVPVGFKYFASGLFDGSLGFGGEESAGASFLKKDGTVWTTDKDGLIMGLLAAEITAVTGKDPGQHYVDLTGQLGTPVGRRMDQPATPAQKSILKKLSPEAVTASSMAGETIIAKLTQAPGNGRSIGGLKVTTENAWFAARPSGTEDIYKIYAESFNGEAHLEQVLEEAKGIVEDALNA